MDPQNREPLTEDIREEEKKNTEAAEHPDNTQDRKPVPVYAERAETVMPEADPDELKALALAYAKYLATHDMQPGDLTFTDSEGGFPETQEAQPVTKAENAAADAEESTHEEPAAESEVNKPEEPAAESKESGSKKKSRKKKSAKAAKPEKKEKAEKPAKAKKAPDNGRKMFISPEPTEEEIQKIASELEAEQSKGAGITGIFDVHDRLQSRFDEAAENTGRNIVTAGHRITSTYRQSRRIIGAAILVIGVLIAIVLAVFDKYTVYEYSYNGMSLGYVNNQEDVTDVLDIAGTMLTENTSSNVDIRFTANQNVTFKPVDARGKSTDDADTVVNKLVYMTDIETEAYGVYDGRDLVAIVKSSDDAEELLLQTREYLGTPDQGMELVSADFINDLDIKPINVLLTSIQSNYDAMKQMTEGGKMEIYHIVEEGETLQSLSSTFGVEDASIFNEDNSEPAAEIMQGDKVCIHEEVSPVSVEMVETGRMKETIEFETVKKESKDYYKGDTYTKQEGVNGVQIFEGTITKTAGEVTKRDGDVEVIKKKKDKIILVGTAERPKTAPTGTYGMPIKSYTLSSNFGYRWGRLHSGIDMAAPTGTPIYASDGGTVQRAGWYAGYGLCVEVNHENGRMTRYGHCSKLLVNVGDKVYQGQNIALVGNTGHSFGSHLHFEINLNGSPVNPRPYLGI